MTEEYQKYKPDRNHLLKQVMERDSSFIYYGNFSDSVNDALIPLAENLMKKTETSMITRKRTFYILIECIQNVNRHHFNTSKKPYLPKELFFVQGDQGHFNITSGNVMKSSDMPSLRSKLMKLNSLSPEGLNAHYKTILKETVLTSKGGAGLGLIEVVRKSSNKIRFKFQQLNEKHSFFSMETTIGKKDPDNPAPVFKGINELNTLRQLYKDHSFGLTLMSRCANNELSDIEAMVYYLNIATNRPFFNTPEAALSLHGLIVQIANICYKQPEFPDPHMLFQFEIKNECRRLIIGWLVPDSESLEFFNSIGEHLNSKPASVMKLLNGLMDDPSAEVELDKIPVRNNMQLFFLQVQVGK